jgi:outer membrane protein assembly factor BamA
VRGYRDSQFRGNSYWAVNAEYRVAPIASRWFALQMVGFVDSGATADSLNPFIELDAASVGGGVRIISPKIYGFVARFDYAYPIINGAGGALSFGAQQFF